ncbi:hypothetical protein Mgra_00009752, partial [Meloidogyne graminicola]
VDQNCLFVFVNMNLIVNHFHVKWDDDAVSCGYFQIKKFTTWIVELLAVEVMRI